MRRCNEQAIASREYVFRNVMSIMRERLLRAHNIERKQNSVIYFFQTVYVYFRHEMFVQNSRCCAPRIFTVFYDEYNKTDNARLLLTSHSQTLCCGLTVRRIRAELVKYREKKKRFSSREKPPCKKEKG